jgi:hypothetical protein
VSDDAASVPVDGFTDNRVPSGHVEALGADDLRRLNEMLPWMCFTADTQGRRFGNAAWKGKREAPQTVPDRRIVKMDEAFGLKGKTVLEVGCFEGVHTIALARLGAEVTAIDSRIENVVKTLVRCNLFGHKPTSFVCDVEKADDMARLPKSGLRPSRWRPVPLEGPGCAPVAAGGPDRLGIPAGHALCDARDGRRLLFARRPGVSATIIFVRVAGTRCSPACTTMPSGCSWMT